MRCPGIFMVALSAPLCLSAETLPIRSFSAADGLPANHIDCVVPDSRGLVWFCTPEGLSRFDGNRFVNFATAEGLPHRSVNAFLETRSGMYLVGTSAGISVFAPGGGNRFTNYQPGSAAAENLVTTLYQSPSGKIWCGTFRGLFELTPEFKFGPQKLAGENPVPAVSSLVEDSRGNLWVGTNAGIEILGASGAHQHLGVAHGLPNEYTNALFQDNRGRIWAAVRGGIALMKPGCMPGACRVDQAYTEHDGLAHRDVHALAAAGDGSLWIGTSGGISRMLSDSPAKFQNLTRAQGLTDRQVNTLATDRAGNMWVGTEGAGAMRIEPAGFTTFREQDGMPSDRVWSVFSDRAGDILAVTIRVPERTKTLDIFDGLRFHAIVPQVFGHQGYWGMDSVILQSRAGEWWMATYVGLCRFAAMPPEDLARRKPLACYAPDTHIFKIFEDSKGGIWASAQSDKGDRLMRWDPQTKLVTLFSDGPSHAALMVGAFAEDHGGNVWMGSWSGGDLYRYTSGAFLRASPLPGVPAGGILALRVDRMGRLWVGSRAGLAVIENPAAFPFRTRTYAVKDGLAAGSVLCLVDDQEGRIYAGTWKGIDRLDPATGMVKHFTSADGLARGQMNTAMRDHAGNLWFGTTQGLSRLTPTADRRPSAPSVLITDLRAGRNRHPISQAGATTIAGIELQPSYNQLHVEFVGLTEEPEQNLRYKYMLDGGGEGWQGPEYQHEANYPGLPPGRYRFLVKAVNSAGDESPRPAEIDFTVLPPFWRSAWFEALALAVLAGAMAAAHRYRVAQAVNLERMRTAIATDLHDDIGAGLSQIAILSEVARLDRESGKPQPSERLERVATLARQLADSMSDIVWSIRTEPENLSALVPRMREFAIDLLESQSIRFELRAPETAAHAVHLSLQARRQLLLIFKECIHNASRHSACTAVEAQVEMAGNEVILRVTDNGRGLNGRDPAFRTGGGNGIPNMRRRAESLGGRLNVISNDGGGCTVEARLPVHHRFGKAGL